MTKERIIVCADSKVIKTLQEQGSIIEVAPPKDWKPVCYFRCNGYGLTDDNTPCPECRACPFRKLEGRERKFGGRG